MSQKMVKKPTECWLGAGFLTIFCNIEFRNKEGGSGVGNVLARWNMSHRFTTTKLVYIK